MDTTIYTNNEAMAQSLMVNSIFSPILGHKSDIDIDNSSSLVSSVSNNAIKQPKNRVYLQSYNTLFLETNTKKRVYVKL